MAAAPVSHAEGSHSGVWRGGTGRPAGAGALLRRVGPHPPDSSSGQNSARSLLQDIRGESV